MLIYFAGAENAVSRKTIMVAGGKNFLLSFFYMRGWAHQKVVDYLRLCRSFGNKVFLDSGAHTIIVAFGEDQKGHFENNYDIELMPYIKDYFKFIATYHEYFDAIAELDIGIVKEIGYSKVKKWREDMKKLGLINKMVVVVHFNHFTQMLGGWEDEWRNILNEYPMVAIGDAPDGEILKRHFQIWEEVGKMNKIHGFAETKNEKMLNYPFYSVDSTSWLGGSRFGILYSFNKKTLRLSNKTQKDKNISSIIKLLPAQFQKKAYLFDTSTKVVGKMRDVINIKAFQEAERYITDLWTKRGITFK